MHKHAYREVQYTFAREKLSWHSVRHFCTRRPYILYIVTVYHVCIVFHISTVNECKSINIEAWHHLQAGHRSAHHWCTLTGFRTSFQRLPFLSGRWLQTTSLDQFNVRVLLAKAPPMRFVTPGFVLYIGRTRNMSQATFEGETMWSGSKDASNMSSDLD